MSQFLDEVKSRVPSSCQAKRCKKAGCSIDLRGMDPQARAIVDMDCRELGVPGDQKRCDYVVFSSYKRIKWVIPMEMKRGKLDDSVAEQIQAGVDFADKKFIPEGSGMELQPLCVVGGGGKRATCQEIRRAKVKFRNREYGIEILRSRGRLAEALDKALG